MNRFAKKFRVMGSLCILLNLAVLFLPMIRRVQENYPDITHSQANYIQSAFANYFSFVESGPLEITSSQANWILAFLLLPALISFASGIWGIVGSYVQKSSSILAFAALLLYIGMAANLSYLWPEALKGQEICRGAAPACNLAATACSAVFGVLSLLSVPRKVKNVETVIPKVEEIKQQQAEAKYNILMEDQKEDPQMPSQPVGTGQEQYKKIAHGVLVGVTGLYAGAEIPLTNGEYLLLGRHTDNHLVFEGQKNVSRNHCRIRWDEKRQKYIFRDYSSNGTFINGGDDCLPQNLDLELPPGTMVAIGDENNTFCLG